MVDLKGLYELMTATILIFISVPIYSFQIFTNILNIYRTWKTIFKIFKKSQEQTKWKSMHLFIEFQTVGQPGPPNGLNSNSRIPWLIPGISPSHVHSQYL